MALLEVEGLTIGIGRFTPVQEIGFSLYSEMLNQAVRALKAGRGEWWRYPVAFRFVDRGRRPA